MTDLNQSKENKMDVWKRYKNDEIRSFIDVPVPMRDGLNLAANIYTPGKAGRYPVIMAFTGFGKDRYWSDNFEGGRL